MDSFLKYLLNKDKVKDRIFISDPPGPVPLVWCTFEDVPRISGVTFVRSHEWKQTSGFDYFKLYDIFRKQLPNSIPLIDLQYNDDCSEFIIEKSNLNADQCAKLLSDKMGISIGRNQAKKPNKPEQIVDPFHKWSRSVFDGITVRKLDLDAITLTEDLLSIKSIIEIKRSKAIKVGKWLPYMSKQLGNSDYWNYIISFTICKIMQCDFFTFHHENIDREMPLKDEDKVDQFSFRFSSLISDETITSFGSESNRVVISMKSLTE